MAICDDCPEPIQARRARVRPPFTTDHSSSILGLALRGESSGGSWAPTMDLMDAFLTCCESVLCGWPVVGDPVGFDKETRNVGAVATRLIENACEWHFDHGERPPPKGHAAAMLLMATRLKIRWRLPPYDTMASVADVVVKPVGTPNAPTSTESVPVVKPIGAPATKSAVYGTGWTQDAEGVCRTLLFHEVPDESMADAVQGVYTLWGYTYEHAIEPIAFGVPNVHYASKGVLLLAAKFQADGCLTVGEMGRFITLIEFLHAAWGVVTLEPEPVVEPVVEPVEAPVAAVAVSQAELDLEELLAPKKRKKK